MQSRRLLLEKEPRPNKSDTQNCLIQQNDSRSSIQMVYN